MIVNITQANLAHVRELSRTMRDKDKLEAERLGLTPHRGLHYAFKRSTFRRTALLNNEVLAMWGIAGAPLSISGQPWLITSTNVKKISPIKFARLYKKEVEDMRANYDILRNFVDASYEGAVRMLEIAGFDLSEPFEFGPENALFRMFTMTTES